MKVVINSCHGGFGLSHEAMLRYCELKGLTVYAERTNTIANMQYYMYWLVSPEERFDLTDVISKDLNEEEYAAAVEKYNSQIIHDRNIARNDPTLIQVIEELGESANGDFARLKIVEIPDDVNFYIDEYDGNEWVAEMHRKWS